MGIGNRDEGTMVSHLALFGGAVVKSQEGEYLLLCLENRQFPALVYLVMPVPLLSGQSLVRQLQAHVMGSHPRLAIEDVATGEVEKGEGVLFDWVVLDVDPMMLSLEDAHPHIGRTAPLSEQAGLGKTLSDEPLPFQLTNKVAHQLLLHASILPADQQVDIPTGSLPSSVGPHDLQLVQPVRSHHLEKDSLQVLEYPRHLLSRDAFVELLEVLQAHCHIPADEFGMRPQVLHSPDTLVVEFLGLLCPHAPDSLQLLAGSDLSLSGEVLEFADAAGLDELSNLLEDGLGQALHLPQVIDGAYLLGVALDLGDGADILELPGVGLRVVGVDVVELLQLGADGLVAREALTGQVLGRSVPDHTPVSLVLPLEVALLLLMGVLLQFGALQFLLGEGDRERCCLLMTMGV